jgi:hypothetical protein
MLPLSPKWSGSLSRELRRACRYSASVMLCSDGYTTTRLKSRRVSQDEEQCDGADESSEDERSDEEGSDEEMADCAEASGAAAEQADASDVPAPGQRTQEVQLCSAIVHEMGQISSRMSELAAAASCANDMVR